MCARDTEIRKEISGVTLKLIRLFIKNIRILFFRLRTQGLWVTAQWAYARLIPLLTGNPPLRFSRVTPQLYVGPQYRRWGRNALLRKGIDSDVNMRIEFDDAAHGLDLTHYCYLPTVDDDPISTEYFEKGIAFIRERIAAGGKVYIHCTAGVGRAPSMAAAYLMAEGQTLDEALAIIREARPFIKPTPVQMEALKAFEQSLNHA
jgi:dual specificity MAP kinase phosphatase